MSFMRGAESSELFALRDHSDINERCVPPSPLPVQAAEGLGHRG